MTDKFNTAKELLEAKAGEMFIQMENKSFLEVGHEFGLGEWYSNEPTIRSAVSRAYNMVLDEPDKYGITDEQRLRIHAAVDSRRIKRTKGEITPEGIAKMSISEMMTSNRDKAADLIRRKLEYLDKNSAALKAEKLKDLMWVLGTLFDKGQIIAGQATEHIAVMSSIPEHINPDEALQAIMKMREELQANQM